MPSSAVQTCARSEEHTSELQSHDNLVCRLLLEKNNHSTSGPHNTPPSRVHYSSSTCLRATQWSEDSAVTCRWLGGGASALAWKVYFFFNDRAPTEVRPFSRHATLSI